MTKECYMSRGCFLCATLLVACCFMTLCSNKQSKNENSNTAAKTSISSEQQIEYQALSLSINLFGLTIYRNIDDSENNRIVSPLSMYTVFCMLLGGSGGATQKEIKKLLYVTRYDKEFHTRLKGFQQYLNSIEKTDEVEIKMKSSLWVQNDFKVRSQYVKLLRDHYFAAAENVDFRRENKEACEKINKWIEINTNGKIQNILQNLSDETKAVLANAMYFKADWKENFDTRMTMEMPFYITEDDSLAVQMMKKGMDKILYHENELIQLIDLPYANDELSMTILLPRKNISTDSILNNLEADQIQDWRNSALKTDVIVYLPKFRAECRFSLSETLNKLGIRTPFDRDLADFSLISAEEGLVLTDVVHKSYVEVNEEGTEAAAATGAISGVLTSRQRASSPPVFKADHPFFFMIRDTKSGCYLMCGKVANPK